MPQYTRKAKGAPSPWSAVVRQLAELHAGTPPRSPFPGCSRRSPISSPSRAIAEKPERLLENLGAAEVGLTDDEVAKIDGLLNGLDLMVFGTR